MAAAGGRLRGARPGALRRLGDISTLFTAGGPLGHWILVGAGIALPAALFLSPRTGLAGTRAVGRPTAAAWSRLAWWGVALAIMPVLHLAGLGLQALFGGPSLPAAFTAIGESEVFRNLLRVLPATALWGGPMGEEAGWRGFAMPRLQRRFDPLLASVLLGAAWAVWHLPLHLTGYYNQAMGSPLAGMLLRVFTTVPLAIVFTWTFNRSGGSVFAMVLLHTAVNVTSGLAAPGWGMFAATAVAVALMVVLDRMYRKAPPEPQRA